MTEDRAPGRRRRSGGAYPLWLGIVAMGGFTALWLSRPDDGAPAAVDAGPPVDAAAPAPAPAAAAEAAPARLAWRVAPRPPIEAGVLDGCLARAGFERALAVQGEPVLVTYPGRVRPITLRVADGAEGAGVEVSTAVEDDARLAATLHVAITACLYVEGAAVLDPVLGRRLVERAWPQLGDEGGLPVQHLVAVEARGDALLTRGLARLGRSELALVVGSGDGAAARRILEAYVAAAVVAPAGAARLERAGGHAARPIAPEVARAAGWWTVEGAGSDVRVLADPEADPPRPVALPRPSPRRPPAEAARPERRPKSRSAPRSEPKPEPGSGARSKPAPKPAPKPQPRAPVPFSPAYR